MLPNGRATTPNNTHAACARITGLLNDTTCLLKNAIDWASRPTGQSVIYGKPAAVMGAAAGRSGSMRAQIHLRQIFVPLNVQGLNKPEIFVTFAKEKFDEDGRLIDEDFRNQVAAQLTAFKAWIELLQSHSAHQVTSTSR